MEWLESTFLNNSVRNWVAGVGIGVVSFIVLRVVVAVAAKRLHALAERTDTHWDELLAQVLGKTKAWFIFVVAIYVAVQLLTLPERLLRYVDAATIILLLLQAGIWASTAVTSWLEAYRQKQLKEDPVGVTTMSALGFLAKVALWGLVLLLALDNLGFDVTALVAGLGISGIAVALAVQNVLGDLLASLSIVLDKPFVIGDFLIIDDYLGSVEYIGLKTTRIRSLSGEQLIFSNGDLLKSRIRNYGRMYQRRAVFGVGVTYQTPKDKLEKIPTIIREAVQAQANTRFDRSHFKAYGDFSLNFETVYYVTVPDYNAYMDVQQAINLRIYERFVGEGIEFAYPTQTVFVARQSA